MQQFSDYIIYVDESGDHEMVKPDPQYPIFVLAFCIFKISDYVESAVPQIQHLKFKYFGHDMAILHERDIRKQQGDFSMLHDKQTRNAFHDDLN